jgi:hypothetical protein
MLVLASNSPHDVLCALSEPVVLDSSVGGRVLVGPITAREGIEVLTWIHCLVHGLQDAGGCSKHKYCHEELTLKPNLHENTLQACKINGTK